MSRSTSVACGLALILLAVTGCTNSIEGKAAPPAHPDSTRSASAPASPTSGGGPASPPPPSTPEGIDFRTADPCSFLAKDAFDKIIKSSTGQINNSEYSSCGLLISGLAGKKAVSWDIELDMSSTFTSAEQFETLLQVSVNTEQVGGTAVFEGQSKAEGCLRAFQLPGINATLMLTAKGKSLECAAADAVLTSALEAISTKTVGHYKMPKNSLGRADMCAEFLPQAKTLLGDAATADQSGVHGCRWAAGKLAVSATLTAAQWPPADYPGGTKEKSISGHPTMSATSSSAQGFYAQGTIDLGGGTVGQKGTVDQISLIATQTGSGDTVKSGFGDFLAAVAHTRLT